MRTLLVLATLLPALAFGAIPTTTVTGQVRQPNDLVPTSGTITCTLSQAGSVLDGAIWQRVAGQATTTIGANGAVSFALVPNDAISPSGTVYACVFSTRLSTGRPFTWSETWRVDSSPDPVDIGAVVRLNVIPGLAVAPVPLSGDLGGTYVSPQVVGTHLSSPLPEAQGGSGATSLDAGVVLPAGGTAAGTLAKHVADAVRVTVAGAACDNAADDTDEIKAAIAEAASLRRPLLFPAGTCIISDTLDDLTGGLTVIQGAGSQATTIKWANGASGTGKAIFRLRGRTITMRGIHLDGNSTNAPDTGIDIYPSVAMIAQQHLYEDVWVGTASPPLVGLWSHDAPGSQQHEMFQFRGSRFTGRDIGIKFDKIHEDLWFFEGCYLGHTSASGASIRAMPGSNGIGLFMVHTWLIGPNIGMDMQGSWQDITWQASGSEGPIWSIDLTVGTNMTMRGQGIGGKLKVRTGQTLFLRTERTNWFAYTGTNHPITTETSSAVVWESFRDNLYLDSVIQQDPDLFVAQVETGPGLISFAAVGTYRRRLSEPTKIGGSNTAWFYTTGIPMLEVQTGRTDSPIATFKRQAGATLLELGDSIGSTAQPGMIFGGVRMFTGTGPPGAGTWAVGDIVWNATPAAGGTPGWVCTTAGTPGTWKAMANLAAP